MLEPTQHMWIAAQLIRTAHFRTALFQIRREQPYCLPVLPYRRRTERSGQQLDACMKRFFERMRRRFHTPDGCSGAAICATALAYSANTSCGVSCTYNKVVCTCACPISFCSAGKLTPARIMSLPKVCLKRCGLAGETPLILRWCRNSERTPLGFSGLPRDGPFSPTNTCGELVNGRSVF